MPDDTRKLAATDSPCIAVCTTLYDDICRGCGRTAMEVANWVFLDDAEKQQVRERITQQGYPRGSSPDKARGASGRKN
ncbi:MAG TPA: DUF1289 domain-containing protein [Candidimonas sp.]|nr:DUF1289 domain-containing protein [Candidimonas sp.]